MRIWDGPGGEVEVARQVTGTLEMSKSESADADVDVDEWMKLRMRSDAAADIESISEEESRSSLTRPRNLRALMSINLRQ